jgi:glycine C-acetyltransferase
MLNAAFTAAADAEIAQLKADRVYKRLNHLESPQGARVRMEGRGEVIVLSSNNYLGLANHPAVVTAGVEALHRYGAGTASVRFICGTFALHRNSSANSPTSPAPRPRCRTSPRGTRTKRSPRRTPARTTW